MIGLKLRNQLCDVFLLKYNANKCTRVFVDVRCFRRKRHFVTVLYCYPVKIIDVVRKVCLTGTTSGAHAQMCLHVSTRSYDVEQKIV